MADDMIRLEGLCKRFPGQHAPAVEGLSLRVPAGRIAVLVGPSGCGKTTTMRMVNRIIEPDTGRIYLDGQDVTARDADQLRRQIGYVIQQVGLFPHLTVAQNVSTVPRMLKWDKARTRRRVDEMLDLMGLDPARYRDRYPKALSGGERQRVGVARALCADPPVMLMDEPFGAIDPINRDRLQNEFLRLQAELRKTILFVTHDIDEAIKMGDRIAILRERSEVVQYDTPANILAAPADDFVRDFLGGRRTLRRLGLARLGPEELRPWPVVDQDGTPGAALEQLRAADVPAVLVADRTGRPVRWADATALERATSLRGIGHAVPGVRLHAPLADVLDALLAGQAPGVAVADGDGRHVGVVDLPALVQAAGRMHEPSDERSGGRGEVHS